MWKLWVLFCAIIGLIIYLVFFIIGGVKNYKKRYQECLVDIDEAFLDTIRATRLLMEELGYEQAHINVVIIETIEKNHLVQRIFEKHAVLYLWQTNRNWIINRVNYVKKSSHIDG